MKYLILLPCIILSAISALFGLLYSICSDADLSFKIVSFGSFWAYAAVCGLGIAEFRADGKKGK